MRTRTIPAVLLALVAALAILYAGSAPAYAPTSGITVQDEGVTKGTGITTLNFTGTGVTASAAGTTGTVSVPGAAGGGRTGTVVYLKDAGGQPGPCDAGKAAANDTAYASLQAQLQTPGPGGEVGGTIDLERYTWCFAHAVLVKNKTVLAGEGRSATRIEALPGFSDPVTNSQNGQTVNRLVELGSGSGNPSDFCFGCRVENLTISAGSVAGLVPLTTYQANELSGAKDVLISGFTGTGVWAQPGCSIISFDGMEVYGNAGAGTSGLFRGECWGENTVKGVTANAAAPAAPGSSGVWLNGFNGTQWAATMLHCEQVETCVKVTAGGSTAKAALSDIQGHSSVSKVVTFDATSQGTVDGVATNGSPTALVDSTPGGKTLTSGFPFYTVNPSRTAVSGSRAAMDPALAATVTALGNQGLVNDQTTP